MARLGVIADTERMDSPVIRKIEASEAEAVVRMWRRSRDAVQPELEARMGHSRDDDLAFFENVLMKTCAIWLAVRDSRPIGLMALENASIEQLYIDPDEQGNGVGSTMIELAKRLSPERLELHTHVSNSNARGFYEHRGFQATEYGTSPAPESEPDVKYEWRGDRS